MNPTILARFLSALLDSEGNGYDTPYHEHELAEIDAAARRAGFESNGNPFSEIEAKAQFALQGGYNVDLATFFANVGAFLHGFEIEVKLIA